VCRKVVILFMRGSDGARRGLQSDVHLHQSQKTLPRRAVRRRRQRIRIRPRQHLALRLWIINILEKFTKSIQEVTLRNNDIDRKSDVQFALNVIELPRNPSGTLFDPLCVVLNRLSAGRTKNEALIFKTFSAHYQFDTLSPLL
jgi:hypothetical protein